MFITDLGVVLALVLFSIIFDVVLVEPKTLHTKLEQSCSASPFVFGFTSEYLKVTCSFYCCEFHVGIRAGMNQDLQPFCFSSTPQLHGRGKKTISELILTSFIIWLLTQMMVFGNNKSLTK